MTPSQHAGRTHHRQPGGRPQRASWATAILIAATLAGLAGCGGSGSAAQPGATTTTVTRDDSAAAAGGVDRDPMGTATLTPTDRAAAQLATAAFQDVHVAEAAGYASSLNTLGCFQDPTRGGMGVHYINQALLDAHLDIAHPEALVYELDANGRVAGLVAHEYIVPVEDWHSATPPELFGVAFHKHPTLPLWVLHVWLWRDNPTGPFQDWNPAVRLCPPNAPIFGSDRRVITQMPPPLPPSPPPGTDVEG
jgi:hypothetical protein